MKTTFLSAFVFAASVSLSAGLSAQTTAPTLVSGPTTVTNPVAPSQTIYSPRLPSAQELIDAAAAQRLTIDKIDQTNAQVAVTYRYSDGQTKLVSYQLLPAGAPAQASGTVTVAAPTSPAPVVVYNPTPPPRVVYYYDDSYPRSYYYDSYPRYAYPPVSLNLGFGFGGYSRGGFYRGGGFHHGWR